jgi:hypothetical protein
VTWRIRENEFVVECHRSLIETAGYEIEGDTGGQWITRGVFETEAPARQVVDQMNRIAPGLFRYRSGRQVREDRLARFGSDAPRPPL